jgi:hypothetical protein
LRSRGTVDKRSEKDKPRVKSQEDLRKGAAERIDSIIYLKVCAKCWVSTPTYLEDRTSYEVYTMVVGVSDSRWMARYLRLSLSTRAPKIYSMDGYLKYKTHRLDYGIERIDVTPGWIMSSFCHSSVTNFF